jgi:hypothetical protein
MEIFKIVLCTLSYTVEVSGLKIFFLDMAVIRQTMAFSFVCLFTYRHPKIYVDSVVPVIHIQIF